VTELDWLKVGAVDARDRATSGRIDAASGTDVKDHGNIRGRRRQRTSNSYVDRASVYVVGARLSIPALQTNPEPGTAPLHGTDEVVVDVALTDTHGPAAGKR
jgi:hypothetical protein